MIELIDQQLWPAAKPQEQFEFRGGFGHSAVPVPHAAIIVARNPSRAADR